MAWQAVRWSGEQAKKTTTHQRKQIKTQGTHGVSGDLAGLRLLLPVRGLLLRSGFDVAHLRFVVSLGGQGRRSVDV